MIGFFYFITGLPGKRLDPTGIVKESCFFSVLSRKTLEIFPKCTIVYDTLKMVVVAQLVRAPGCGPGGRGFESRLPPHIERSAPVSLLIRSFFFFL